MGAVTSVLAAQFTLGAIYLNQPFDIQRWHIGLLAFAIIAIVLMLNVTISRHLNKLAKLAMFWDLALFGIVCCPRRAPSEIDFQLTREDGCNSAGNQRAQEFCFHGVRRTPTHGLWLQSPLHCVVGAFAARLRNVLLRRSSTSC